MSIRGLPVVLRALLAAPLLIAMVAFAQSWLLGALPDGTAGRSAALLLPLIAGIAVWGAFFVIEAGSRARVFVSALERVAGGDFDAPLPSTFGRDLWSVRSTFEETCRELGRLKEAAASADTRRRQLFANLSHELATPMTAILGLLDTLADTRIELDGEQRATLHRALDGELARMTRLVSDLRDLATIEDPTLSLQWQRCDVGELVKEVVERLELAMPSGTPVLLQTARSVACIDRTRLEQVVVNLVLNAKRHAPAGAAARVTVCDHPREVAIEVENEGPVLSDETLQRLGERFFREDTSRTRRTGGLGLGLAIVNAIVERHAGALSFSRGPGGGGLSVSVRLPKQHAAPDLPAKA